MTARGHTRNYTILTDAIGTTGIGKDQNALLIIHEGGGFRQVCGR